MKLLGSIDDDPTPKIQEGGGTAYTLNSRDYKGVMIVVLQECEDVFGRHVCTDDRNPYRIDIES